MVAFVEDTRHKAQEPQVSCAETENAGGTPATRETSDDGRRTTADCICPKCFRPLPGTRIFPQEDRYGRQIRQYLGFCLDCNLGCEVVQFHRENRWLIHKYQYYKPIGTHCRGTGEWVTINELPEPAPVVTGPGGEFDKQITPQTIGLLKKLKQTLDEMYQTIECLMRGL